MVKIQDFGFPRSPGRTVSLHHALFFFVSYNDATMAWRSRSGSLIFLLVLLVGAFPNEGSSNRECDKMVERAVDLGGQGDMAGGGRPSPMSPLSLCFHFALQHVMQENDWSNRLPWTAERCCRSSGQLTTLEATQGQISSQSPTDDTSSRWHLYGS